MKPSGSRLVPLLAVLLLQPLGGEPPTVEAPADAESTMPSAPLGNSGERPRLTIALDRDGHASVDGVRFSAEQLEVLLETAARLDPETGLLVRADREVPFREVTRITRLATECGIDDFRMTASAATTDH